jgi:hypothetical protein
MKDFEKVGNILIEHNAEKKQVYDGANYFRRLVKWLDNRSERLNENKSTLQLMYEYNKFLLNPKN